jgi:dipeptidase D
MLQPQRVWHYFAEICNVPRPSKKEGKIVKYLLDFAAKHKLEVMTDDVDNVLIRKPATKGRENAHPVILQSHIDMVCEKNSDIVHDWDKDPIVPWVDGEWLRAKGTTLGADDGIGMAVQLALLEATDIEHGPLECLFTVDEETGLTGAFALKKGFLKGRILLNLDSEDEGQLFIGCAGGKDTVATFKHQKIATPAGHCGFRLSVSGLKGGHSGDDINKGRGNAVKVITRFLWNGAREYGLKLNYIKAGNLRNAIAREAYAIIALPDEQKDHFINYCDKLTRDITAELKVNDPGLVISITPAALPANIIDSTAQHELLLALCACPHGVISMTPDMPGLVETSTNLASVKMRGCAEDEASDDDIRKMGEDEIRIATSQRSSLESGKKDVVDMVDSVFMLAGARTAHNDGYPGWSPNTKSQILEITRKSYKKLFGNDPEVLVIHAGLECGLIGEKYPGMDMISYGPTLRGVHSPDECINIPTVQRFWDLTLEILKSV